ncbi:MAG TPA: substrate-binding domain-containing protein [Chthoniobacterales bacterium]
MEIPPIRAVARNAEVPPNRVETADSGLGALKPLDYPTDVDEAEWSRIQAFVPEVPTKGRPPKYSRRQMVNAILYARASRCPWRMLPHDLPPWKAVYNCFVSWEMEGVWAQIEGVLDHRRRSRKNSDKALETSPGPDSKGSGSDPSRSARKSIDGGFPALTQKSESNVFTVIPKGYGQNFWKRFQAGSLAAAHEYEGGEGEIRVLWNDPGRWEDDCKRQIELVESQPDHHVDGVLLGPLDCRALINPVNLVLNANIPVVIADSALESEQVKSFIATDNFRGGCVAANHLGNLLSGKGSVVLLRQLRHSASTNDRANGFLHTLKNEFPRIKVLSANHYAGGSQQTAYAASRDLLARYGPKVDGIFAVNEYAVEGMLRALREADLAAGKVKLVGFDCNPYLRGALDKGDVHGLVVQDPYAMGYLGIQALIQLARKRPVPATATTRLRLVTANDRLDPEFDSAIPAQMDGVNEDSVKPALSTLSSREAEIHRWIKLGKRDSEIATILGISTRTVENHVHRILQKLMVETRTAAAMVPVRCAA